MNVYAIYWGVLDNLRVSNNSLKTKVEEWLEKEGYSLEFLTATVFERYGFRVLQGEHYEDNKNGIWREADVVAHRTYEVEDTLFRVSHIVECKWSKDKPWVIFCSSGSQKHPGASIAQSIGSYLGRAILWHMAGNSDLYGTSHFSTPEQPGFAGRQALANGKDLFYSSMQSVTASAILRADYYDNPVQNALLLPNYAEIVFPVIIVNGTLYKALYDNSSEKIELEEAKHVRLHWSGSESWSFDVNVDIVSSDYIDEFVCIRNEESEILFSSMKNSYLNLKECFVARSLAPLSTGKAPRGFIGLPTLLQEFTNAIKT